LPIPYIYPTENGCIQLEWKTKDDDELEIDLKTLTGDFRYGNDGNKTIDLKSNKDWEFVIEKLKQSYKT
jgi:hypothetical protein